MIGTRARAALFGTLVAFATGEGVARLTRLDLRWLSQVAPRQKADGDVHVPLDDPQRLYGLRPGAARTFFDDLGDRVRVRRVRINALGLRDPERGTDRPAGTVRIVAIGSSNTYGASVSDEDCWPAQLERTLRGSGDAVEVWNAGVAGTATIQQLALARTAIERWSADVVLLQLYNMGTRLVLKNDDVGRAVTLDSRLWDELLCDGVGGPVGAAFFARSALWRTVRVAQQKGRFSADREGCVGAVTHRADEGSLLEMQRFATEFAAVPVLAVVPPAGVATAFLDSVPFPLLDLRTLVGEDAAALPIHPGAEVYTRYAAALAGALRQRGCVGSGAPHASCGAR